MRENLHSQGFAVARGVLREAEVLRLRKTLEGHFQRRWLECDCGKVQPHGAVAVPDLEWLFSHPRILETVRSALGREDILFTGNCDLHQNKLGNWHKDMGRIHGGAIQGDVYAQDDCQVLKVGVYTQEQDASTSFRARVGSHRTEAMDQGEIQTVPVEVGDVLIFDVRLTHAGMLPSPMEDFLWRASRALSSNTREASLGRIGKQAWWKLRGKAPRQAAFFTYGAPNGYTAEFARNNLRYLVESGLPESSLPLSPTLMEAMERAGVEVFEGVAPQGVLA